MANLRPGDRHEDEIADAHEPRVAPTPESERDGLDLEVKPEIKARKRVETALARDSAGQARVVEALASHRASLDAIRQAVAAHAAETQRIEEHLRTQVSESEYIRSLVEDLQSSRRTIGEDFSALTQRLDHLTRQPQATPASVPAAATAAPGEVAALGGADAPVNDEFWRAKWDELAREWPDVFDPAHLPNRRTFENLCDAFVEMARLNVVIDEGVRGTLTQLRRSGDESDRLSAFVVRFMKQPKLLQTLREALLSRRKSNALNDALRALRAWALALANGLFTAIVHGPKVAEPVLDPAKWDMKKGSFETQEAATGRHYRDNFRHLCGAIGTELRKEANNCVFDDYNEMIRLRK